MTSAWDITEILVTVFTLTLQIIQVCEIWFHCNSV